MHLVSTSMVKIIAESISALKGVPQDSLFENAPIQLSDLDRNGRWVRWDSFVDWIDWLDCRPFGALDWAEVGRVSPNTPSFAIAHAIVRASVSVRFAYYIASKWLGESLFPAISSKVEYVGKHNVRETLVLADSARPCPKIFMLFAGSLSMLPEKAFGLARANVIFKMEGREAIYDIEVPQQHTLWSLFFTYVKSIFSYRKLLMELENQQRQLSEKSRQLFTEREELKNLIKLFPDGVWVHRDGIIRYVNEQMETYLNRKREELLGRSIIEFVHPSSRELVIERNIELKRNPGKVNPPMEFSMLRKNSSEPFAVECTAIHTVFEGEKAVVVVMRDLTERKKLQVKLMQTDRLTSLGQLAAGVGHEINNPLCSIMMKLEMLREKTELTSVPEAERILSEIGSGLERIKYITNDLKTLARNRDEDVLSNIDLNKILSASIHMTKNQIEHRARLVFEPGQIRPVYANEARLSQVFLNLLINAIQAIDPGRADENEISVRTSIVNDQVVVEIKDSGVGVPAEMKDRLFQPFQTTKPMGFGTGLGLSICHSIVRKYNGSIECESTFGSGALFRVILPVSAIKETGPMVAEFAPALAPKIKATGKRVLIVDDDKEVLGVFHEIVSRHFNVLSFRDSREALNVLTQGEQFDCIVCDLMMPNIGGMEFYQRLQEVSPGHLQKVIFVTGGSFTPVTDQFLRKPGLILLEKPVAFDDLIKAIDDLIGLN